MNKTSLLTGLILFAGAATFAISPKIIPGHAIPIAISWAVLGIGFLLLLHVILSLRFQSKPPIFVELILGIPLIGTIPFTTHPTLIPGTNIPPAISWTLFALALVLVLKTLYAATFRSSKNGYSLVRDEQKHGPQKLSTGNKPLPNKPSPPVKLVKSATKTTRIESKTATVNDILPNLMEVNNLSKHFKLFRLKVPGEPRKDYWVIVPCKILDITIEYTLFGFSNDMTLKQLMHNISPDQEAGKVVSFWSKGKSNSYIETGKPLNTLFSPFQKEAKRANIAESLTKKKRYLFGSLANPSGLIRTFANDPLDYLETSLKTLSKPIFELLQGKTTTNVNITLCIPPLPIPKIEVNNDDHAISVGAWETILENFFLCLQKILKSKFPNHPIQIFKVQHTNPCDYADSKYLANWQPDRTQLLENNNFTPVDEIQSCVDPNSLFGLEESKVTGAFVVQAGASKSDACQDARRKKFVEETGHVWTSKPKHNKTDELKHEHNKTDELKHEHNKTDERVQFLAAAA